QKDLDIKNILTVHKTSAKLLATRNIRDTEVERLGWIVLTTKYEHTPRSQTDFKSRR
ncbi:unnamed protein product, partial [Candidula unifasciata]